MTREQALEKAASHAAAQYFRDYKEDGTMTEGYRCAECREVWLGPSKPKDHAWHDPSCELAEALSLPTPQAVDREGPFDRLKLDVCLAAEQWVMHRTKRGIPHTSMADAEAALEKAATEFLDTKIALIQKHIEASRAASPDGKTSWDRVEEYRIKHGHLPAQDGSKEPGCLECEKERP